MWLAQLYINLHHGFKKWSLSQSPVPGSQNINHCLTTVKIRSTGRVKCMFLLWLVLEGTLRWWSFSSKTLRNVICVFHCWCWVLFYQCSLSNLITIVLLFEELRLFCVYDVKGCSVKTKLFGTSLHNVKENQCV